MPKLLWGLLGAIALVYAAVCGLLYLRQQQLVYFPAFTRVPEAQTSFALTRGEVVLRGWMVNPGRPRAILYFGGNGESIQFNRETFERWLPGHTVYLVAYRGYGASDGKPSQRALFADALALFDHVQAEHPQQPVSLLGRSLGSGVASYLAAQRRVGRVALVTPFDSLAGVAQAHYPWLPVHWLLRERYESTRYLAGHRGPLLVVRAGGDEVVPSANTDRLIASLPQPPRVVSIPNASHNDLDEDAYGRALAAFFE
jgi:pimeloyl-ACP methyl ester carboxylesterase